MSVYIYHAYSIVTGHTEDSLVTISMLVWATLKITFLLRICRLLVKGKGKGFPHSIPSVGPGADPGVQAVSPQVTDWPQVIHQAVGCHYFPPGLQLPPQPQSITALWPVSSYTAWWQRHIGVNNLPKVVTQRHLEQDLNSRPVDHKPKCLTHCTTAAQLSN